MERRVEGVGVVGRLIPRIISLLSGEIIVTNMLVLVIEKIFYTLASGSDTHVGFPIIQSESRLKAL